MSTEFKVNQSEINNMVKRLQSLGKEVTDRKILQLIALTARNNIIQRTMAGLDVNYKPMKEYNRNYALSEGKTTVNMTKTGKMLNSMIFKVMGTDTAKIFFATARGRMLAKIHNTGKGKMPERNFFGISARDKKQAQQAYLKEVLRVKRAKSL